MPARKQGKKQARTSRDAIATSHLCIATRKIAPFVDAHRALELLEDYHAKLTGTDDRQLRSAIEKVIRIFRSRLFQALLGKNEHNAWGVPFFRRSACADIQEFYEETLLDSGKSKEQKTHETMEMAAAWEKQSPMPHKKKKEVAVSATAAATAAAVVVEKENDKASSSPVASDLLPPPPEATVTFERQAFLDESMPPEIPPSTSVTKRRRQRIFFPVGMPCVVFFLGC